MVEKLSTEDREKLVTFGKLSVNFRKLSGKTWKNRLLHLYQSFSSIYIQHKIYQACSKYFSQAINSLITDWTVYTENINPSVLHIDLPVRQDLGLYIFPYRQPNQLLMGYYRCMVSPIILWLKHIAI